MCWVFNQTIGYWITSSVDTNSQFYFPFHCYFPSFTWKREGIQTIVHLCTSTFCLVLKQQLIFSQDDGVMSRINASVVYIQLKCSTWRQCNGNKATASQPKHKCAATNVFTIVLAAGCLCVRGFMEEVSVLELPFISHTVFLSVYIWFKSLLHENKHITAS